MIHVLVSLIAGAGLAAALVLFASRRGSNPRLAYAVGLAAAAAIYVAFAVTGGAGTRYLVLEVLGLVGFGTAAWYGWRTVPILLAAGWFAHVAWDLTHLYGSASDYTPQWYAWLCLSFDIVIAAAALRAARDR